MQQNLIDAARAVIAADRAGELTDELINALEAAANAEAVPAGELVAHVKRGTNTSFIDSTGCKTCWEDLPDGSPLYTAPPVPSDAFALLEIWQTWLGAGRESCSEYDKQLWDRIDAVLASKEPKHD